MEDVFKILAPNNRCYEELFVKNNFNDGLCIHMALGNCWQYSVKAALVLVFVPQILRLLWTRSSQCLSFPAVLLETVTLTSAFVVQYRGGQAPSSDYHDSMLLVVQSAAMLFLVLACRGNILGAVVTVGAYSLALSFLTSTAVVPPIVNQVNQVGMFIVIGSRLIQTLVCFKDRSAGQMSSLTWMILLYKATSGLFSIVQVKPLDDIAMVALITQSAFNGMILSQVLFSNMYYSHGQQKWKSS